MVAPAQHPQRISRLTPVAEVWAAIDRLVSPVASRRVALRDALGAVLAEDIVAADARPAVWLALRDGWAVRADDTVDAGSYAPAILSSPPVRVDAGEPLPPGVDAVAPLDAVDPASSAIMIALAPGDGVLAPAVDMSIGEPLLHAGNRLRASDVAILRAVTIPEITVRMPRLLIAAARRDAAIDAGCAWLRDVIAAQGATAEIVDLAKAFAREDADAILIVGGTGTGRHDASVTALARAGRVEMHGIGLTPGETTAFGFAGTKPVLLIPGRLDAVLAVWLVIGCRLLARLSGTNNEQPAVPAILARKITSTVGSLDIVPVRRTGALIEPLASGYLPLVALARADGYILVPAESEGFPAGAEVAMRALP